jgi:hypothetical protein
VTAKFKPLANHIWHSNNEKPQDTCKHCSKHGHKLPDCFYLGKAKCTKCNRYHTKECWKCDTCNKYGHCAKDCWGENKKCKRANNGDSWGKASKIQKSETVNVAIIEESVNIVEVKDGMTFSTEGQGVALLSRLGGENKEDELTAKDDDYIYEMYDPSDPNDKSLGWYDWLADCATTSHICNDRDLFMTYQPESNPTVTGVGDVKATMKG